VGNKSKGAVDALRGGVTRMWMCYENVDVLRGMLEWLCYEDVDVLSE